MRTKKIDEQTLAILSRVTVDGNGIFLTCGQLDRKQYVAVNEILENIGGKWNKKVKAHIFDDDPTDRLEAVLLAGEIVPPKNYGYFPTPPGIAQRLIKLAGITPFDWVLEPSAGQGGIADFVTCHKKQIACHELLHENCTVLRDKGYPNIYEHDFLSAVPDPNYSKATMNPPFSYEGHPQADIDHVTHALKFLRPGGRLVSVMGSGVLFRENKKTVEFREMVENCGFFERLPDGSFKESGTNVNTCIVVIDI